MPMLQPVASTVPDTVPAGLIMRAVRSMLSRMKPVGVHAATPADAIGAPAATSVVSVTARTATTPPRLRLLTRSAVLPRSTRALQVQPLTINLPGRRRHMRPVHVARPRSDPHGISGTYQAGADRATPGLQIPLL